MLLIVILVLFTVCVLLWALALVGAIQAKTDYFALLACLLLGVAVFLVGHQGAAWR